MKVNLKSITLRLHPDNIKKVKEIAEKDMRSFNQMVNIILADYQKEKETYTDFKRKHYKE